MGQKQYTAEQIIGKLRQAEMRSAEGKPVTEIVRELGADPATGLTPGCASGLSSTTTR